MQKNSEAAKRGRRNKNVGKRDEKRLTEKIVAHGIDAVQVPFSGAGKDHKGDIIIPSASMLIEAKVRQIERRVTGEKTVTLDLGWVRKVHEDAAKMGCEHCAVILRGTNERTFVAILSEQEYMKYLDYCARTQLYS